MTMPDKNGRKLGFATRQLHAGHVPNGDAKSHAVPIYQTTSDQGDNTGHAADLFAVRQFGNSLRAS